MKLATLHDIRFLRLRILTDQFMIDLQFFSEVNHCCFASQERIRPFFNHKSIPVQCLNHASHGRAFLDQSNHGFNSCFPVMLADIKCRAEAGKATADNNNTAFLITHYSSDPCCHWLIITSLNVSIYRGSLLRESIRIRRISISLAIDLASISRS
ncbi:hypothetical protein D3C76_1468260 [compost metagenome]